MHPGDIVGFLSELDDIIRGRPALAQPPYLHQVSFLDPFAWMFHRDLQTLPLNTLGPPPSMAHCHTASSTSTSTSSYKNNGRRRRKLSGVKTDEDDNIANVGLEEEMEEMVDVNSSNFIKHPTPLFIACSLCASRALEAFCGVKTHNLQTTTTGAGSVSASSSSYHGTDGGETSSFQLDTMVPDSTVRLLLSRLGDACNEVGKALLGTVPQASKVTEESVEQDRRLFSALVKNTCLYIFIIYLYLVFIYTSLIYIPLYLISITSIDQTNFLIPLSLIFLLSHLSRL